MGQHGNYPVHQINAGSPLVSLPVKSRIFLYIVCHIRDVYPQVIICSIIGNTDCIIQILRIFPVNRHHLHLTQISSACPVSLRNLLCHPFRLI